MANSGKGNAHMVIDERLERILEEIDVSALSTQGAKAHLPAMLLLATVIQFIERIPDRLVIETIQKELSWSNLQTLSIYDRMYSTNALCKFRAHLLSDSKREQVFKSFWNCLVGTGVVPDLYDTQVDTRMILREVCNLSMADQLVQAMAQALEELAACQPEWLRNVIIPSWCDRYMQIHSPGEIPRRGAEQEAFVSTISKDARYLLQTIRKTTRQDLQDFVEIRHLERILDEQFVKDGIEYKWMPKLCSSCLFKEESYEEVSRHNSD